MTDFVLELSTGKENAAFFAANLTQNKLLLQYGKITKLFNLIWKDKNTYPPFNHQGNSSMTY